jgi:hypothetical protein
MTAASRSQILEPVAGRSEARNPTPTMDRTVTPIVAICRRADIDPHPAWIDGAVNATRLPIHSSMVTSAITRLSVDRSRSIVIPGSLIVR